MGGHVPGNFFRDVDVDDVVPTLKVNRKQGLDTVGKKMPVPTAYCLP